MATFRQIVFLIKRFKDKKKIVNYLNDLTSKMTNNDISKKYKIMNTQVQRDKDNFIIRIIDKKVINEIDKLT